MDPLWFETCWSTFKYFIILIVSTYYILCISWIIKCLICSHLLLFCLDFSTMAQQTLLGQGLFIIEASRSHSDTTHSVWLLRTSDRPNAGTSTRQHQRQTPMLPAGFEPVIPTSERPQTQALDRSATAIGLNYSSHSCPQWHYLLIHKVHKTASANTGFFALCSR